MSLCLTKKEDGKKNRLLESESEEEEEAKSDLDESDDSMDDESDEKKRLMTRKKSIKVSRFDDGKLKRIEGYREKKQVGTNDGLTAGIPKSVIVRNLLGFWILGLCNNYAYVIMLSAAHDILGEGSSTNGTSSDDSFLPERDCNPISTGAILLANILPSLAIKLVAPFILSYVFVQIGFAIAAAFLSFLLVSFSVASWMTFFGVACASLCSGLGEVTLLRYSTGFDKNVVSTWSSGTGASGVLGAFSYAAFTTAGLSPRKTLLVMLVFPFLMAMTFIFLLVHPKRVHKTTDTNDVSSEGCAEAEELRPKLTMKRKLILIKPLIKYMVPLSLVYLAEYFINQGLFVNVIVFLFEAYYLFIPSVWIIFAFVLFEGLLGGASYVNTFYKITQEVAEPDREFSMGAASMSDSLGITIAGAISIPVHNLLCSVPIPK